MEQKGKPPQIPDRQRRAELRREVKATAYVLDQFKQHRRDQLAEQHRQAARLRVQHLAQRDILKARYDHGVKQVWRAITRSYHSEDEALEVFDKKRGSVRSRIAELFKGKEHFDRQREKIREMFASNRLQMEQYLKTFRRHELRAQREHGQKHAAARRAMSHQHRRERYETRERQERAHGRLIQERLKLMARHAAEMQRERKHGHTNEKGLDNEFRRRA
jgi:hypothetical protein